jgi:hypothetical protein
MRNMGASFLVAHRPPRCKVLPGLQRVLRPGKGRMTGTSRRIARHGLIQLGIEPLGKCAKPARSLHIAGTVGHLGCIAELPPRQIPELQIRISRVCFF